MRVMSSIAIKEYDHFDTDWTLTTREPQGNPNPTLNEPHNDIHETHNYSVLSLAIITVYFQLHKKNSVLSLAIF